MPAMPTRVVDLLLTYDCNSRCPYCFIKDRGAAIPMSPLVLDRAIDWTVETCDGTVELVFLGGEPTLEPGLIERAVHRAREWERRAPVRFQFSMTTNLLNLDEAMGRKLADWGVPYLISVDGYGRRHDLARPAADKAIGSPFALIAERVPKLRALQVHMGARVTPLPKNAQYLFEDLTKLQALGFDTFIVSPATGIDWSDAALESFVEQMTRFGQSRERLEGEAWPRLIGLEEPNDYKGVWGCGAALGRYAIDPHGNIFACARFAERDARKGLALGDIFTGVDPQGDIRKFSDYRAAPRPICDTCADRDECLGGCPAVNLDETGSLAGPSPNECRFVKAMNRIQRALAPSLAEA